MIVTDDIFQLWEGRDRVGSQSAGHHGRLYAADVESAACPVAGYRQVIVRVVQGRDSVSSSSRQR